MNNMHPKMKARMISVYNARRAKEGNPAARRQFLDTFGPDVYRAMRQAS